MLACLLFSADTPRNVVVVGVVQKVMSISLHENAILRSSEAGVSVTVILTKSKKGQQKLFI